jgi:hypothetical protein
MEIVHIRDCAVFGDGRLNRLTIAAGFTEKRYDVIVNLELAVRGDPAEMPPDEQRRHFLYADRAQAWRLALTAQDLKYTSSM